MVKKLVLVGLMVLVALSVFGIGMVSADDGSEGDTSLVQIWDDDMGWIAVFGDGRINNADMTASTVIYYDTAAQFIPNDDGDTIWQDVIVGIELWTVDPETSAGQLALYVPISALDAAMNATSDMQIAAGNGVVLYYAPAANEFTVTGPNGYSFAWSPW